MTYDKIKNIFNLFQSKSENLDKKMMEKAKVDCKSEYGVMEEKNLIGKSFPDLNPEEQEYYTKFLSCFTKSSFGIGEYYEEMFGSLGTVQKDTRVCVDKCIIKNKEDKESFPIKECLKVCMNNHVVKFEQIYKNGVAKLDEITLKF